MADTPSTRDARTWASSLSRLSDLNLYLLQAPAHERDQVEREIAELEEDLLDTPAPHLAGVQRKLEILWDGELHGLDPDSEDRRLILEDLDGLIQAQHELLGA